jgi:hypothetical protein
LLGGKKIPFLSKEGGVVNSYAGGGLMDLAIADMVGDKR